MKWTFGNCVTQIKQDLIFLFVSLKLLFVLWKFIIVQIYLNDIYWIFHLYDSYFYTKKQDHMCTLRVANFLLDYRAGVKENKLLIFRMVLRENF
jgi:hypothetical protein